MGLKGQWYGGRHKNLFPLSSISSFKPVKECFITSKLTSSMRSIYSHSGMYTTDSSLKTGTFTKTI
jgi:hypothetical protein